LLLYLFISNFRVADYGFTKLIELFEAIPTTIEITEDVDGERILQLTDSERLNVVGDHIGFLIKNNSVVKRQGKQRFFMKFRKHGSFLT
jgi:hypothetical protein